MCTFLDATRIIIWMICMCTFLNGTRSLIPTYPNYCCLAKKNRACVFGLPIMVTSKVPTKEQHKPVAPMSKVAGAMTRRTCQLAQVEGGWDISDSSPLRKMKSSSHVAKIQGPQNSHSSLKTNITALPNGKLMFQALRLEVLFHIVGGNLPKSWWTRPVANCSRMPHNFSDADERRRHDLNKIKLIKHVV